MLSVDQTPRSHWPLGRIVEVYPGKDGIVRSVKVKTPNNELIRPSGQLYLLEVRQKWLEKFYFSSEEKRMLRHRNEQKVLV